MLNPRQTIKKCVVVIMLWVFLLLPWVCVAQDISVSQLDTASRMLIALEQKVYLEKEIAIGDARVAELEEQLKLVNAKIVLLQDIIDLQNAKIELYKSKEEVKDKLDAEKDKLHQQELKAAKPSFMDEVRKYATGAVGGAALLGLALLLL
jgi:TolA-binding protein